MANRASLHAGPSLSHGVGICESAFTGAPSIQCGSRCKGWWLTTDSRCSGLDGCPAYKGVLAYRIVVSDGDIDLGGGCGATTSPTLMFPPPRIGKPVTATATELMANAAGAMIVSFGIPVGVDLGRGCVGHLGPLVFFLLPFRTDATGKGSATFHLPNLQALDNLGMTFQAFALNKASGLGFDLTNGWHSAIH